MQEIALVRLDPGLPVPQRAHPADAGLDLCTTSDVEIAPGERTLVGTGIAVALPEGYAAFVHPRSGLAAREGLGLLNAPGLVDAGYRGEVRVCLVNHDPRRTVALRRGDRVAQLVIQRVELPVVREVEWLPGSTRGSGGFGSSGGWDTTDGAGPIASGGPPTDAVDRPDHDRGVQSPITPTDVDRGCHAPRGGAEGRAQYPDGRAQSMAEEL